MLPEPKFESCQEEALCQNCGMFLGYYVTERNAKNAVKAHQNSKTNKCKDMIQEGVEFEQG